MYSTVSTAILHGIESIRIQVEVDVSDGLPSFDMVGMLSAGVREARERVRVSLKNCGYQLPVKRITVNLYPADIPKSGTGFDLPIAIGILSAMGVIPAEKLKDTMIVGEVNLNGEIHPVRGILSMVCAAKEQGFCKCVIPDGNKEEGALVGGICIYPVKNLKEAVDILLHDKKDAYRSTKKTQTKKETPDFSEIKGQEILKRACEIAVAGRHHLLMVGPPGAGKTMAARCIPSILPQMTEEECMETSKIYSAAGLLNEKEGLLSNRPLRAPHHSITTAAMAGGGQRPTPGEISLAHKGVLFLDELTEFKADALELLRQPLEEKKIVIARVGYCVTYPADFMLVCAMNPCKCGYFPDVGRCHCTQATLSRYIGKISQPLLDRMDLCVEVPRAEYAKLSGRQKGLSSAQMKEHIKRARKMQKERFAKEHYDYNSSLPPADLDLYAPLGETEQKFMESVYQKKNLTARTMHKIRKVARTIADLDEREEITLSDLMEAMCYRSIERSFWERRMS